MDNNINPSFNVNPIPNSNPNKNKKIWVYLFVLVVLGAGAMAFLKFYQPKQDTNTEPTVAKTSETILIEVPKDKLPSNFPTDLPSEKGVKILQNGNAVLPPNNLEVALHEYESLKTLEQNQKIFTDYLNNGGYTNIETKVPVLGVVIFQGEKDGYRLFFTIRAKTNQSTVTISNVKI